ncbi:MAG: M28 family peptidase [Hyphomonas sp.]|uniref:M28 family peptidase n=1 Tax=Hyphomonas sp. TaxID=87 RepID=UPI00352865B4
MKPVAAAALGALALSLTFTAAADTAAMEGEALLATAQQLIDAAKTDETGLGFVEGLTTEIGPRLAGSPDEQRARDWAVAELKALGFANVRVDGFTIPYWSRTHEHLTVLGPSAQSMVITALGGSRATPDGGLEAEVVRFDTLAGLKAAPNASVTGKIVFIDEEMFKTQDGSGYGLAGLKRRECAKAAAGKGAVACLIRSVGTQHHRMPHTGVMDRSGPGGPMPTGALPAAAVSAPDADQMTRLLARGPVRVNLDIGIETAETAPSGNVIAEVEGGALKDEIVLLGCHLDSWDLGTGAIDDGAGCGIIVGAAKLIDALPGKPERTIRVVLYGSEEVGLFGGDAYARQHSEELGAHVLAAESDFGAGRIWRFQTRFGEGALDHAKTIQSVLMPLGVSPGDNSAGGGPDIGVLARSGVPVVTPSQDGTDYFDFHHTPDDTFDKIDPQTFRQNVAVYAAFAFLAAEAGWDFRAPAQSE